MSDFNTFGWLLFAAVVVAAVTFEPARRALKKRRVGAPTPVTSKKYHGHFEGGYVHPDKSERIRLRNLSLAGRGILLTGDDAIDNKNAGGGDAITHEPDGGIYMAGSFNFDTDANGVLTRGKTMVFHEYEYSIAGSIQDDGTFDLTWSGQGSEGKMIGKVEPDTNITGKFFHPEPDDFVYGVLSGTFTPLGR